MTIVGCRIDGRLIHGQVANLWAGKLNVSRIMVVDDDSQPANTVIDELRAGYKFKDKVIRPTVCRVTGNN